MAKATRIFQASVFDRLLDYDPDREQDNAIGAAEHQRRVRDSIRRDLEVLLNTQQPLIETPKVFPELSQSLLRFGTPGFHGFMLATKEQRIELAKSLEALIVEHEHRLKKVTVELDSNKQDAVRMLHLKIKAECVINESRQALVFDTMLDPAIRQFKIKMA